MNNTEFGKLVKELREAHGMTQEELAYKIGYKSKSSINKIEIGKQDMPRPKLLMLADVLHTSVSRFVGEDDNKQDIRQQLHTLIDTLPDDRLERILRVVQAIEER